MENTDKYYTTYLNKSKSIYYKKPKRRTDEDKLYVVRGVYDIETNNVEGRFIVGGLALDNGVESDDTRERYNISFHNKPYLILNEIYEHYKHVGNHVRYEIAVHNLMFDIQSFLYNLIEKGTISYKDPGKYGKQDKNTYSIIMNERKAIYSCSLNYAGVTIIFWDTYKLYPAKLDKICKTYNLKNYKLKAGEETYNSKDFDTFCDNDVNVDYLCADLLSVAELVDKNLYKKKTASGNAWDSMKKEICLNLGLKKNTDSYIAKIINFWGDNKMNDYCLPGYSGGYCFANPKRAGEIVKGVLHLDINSSYPNAMNSLALPLTMKKSKTIDCERFIVYCKGVFTLKENCFPIIKHPTLMNTYIDYYKGDMLLTDIEYKRIFKNYDVKNFKIIEVMNFPKCEKILSSFVQKNYEIKQTAPEGSFLREKAKLNLNSAYGKLAEHHNGQYYEAFIENSILKFRLSETSALLIETETSRCVIWAMFITAFAREKLYRCMDVLGNNFLYTDTDSIFTDLPEEEVIKRFSEIGEEIHKSNLGAWAIEGHSPLFKCLRAKCYLKTDEVKIKDPDTGEVIDKPHVLNYVIAGYNGNDLVHGYNGAKLRDIPAAELRSIFDDFKIGAKAYDKEVSFTTKYGIKQVKMLSEFEIKEKINVFEFVKNFK